MAEEAVDHACQALTQGEIRNPRSYLKTAFKHAVDRYLRRERRLIPIDFERESEQTRNEFVSEEEVVGGGIGRGGIIRWRSDEPPVSVSNLKSREL